MISFKQVATFLASCALIFGTTQKAEAVTYVTDAGGGAYDQSIAATNFAPAIALATIAVVAIVAVAVQNSHGHHHSHSHSSSSSSKSSSHSRSSH